MQIVSFKKYLLEKAMNDYLVEGGAYGHLIHPYENNDLTFGELQELIVSIYDNNIEFAQEKTDGVNIMFSMKDGKVIFARNKGNLKNFGENAFDVDGLKNKGWAFEKFGKYIVDGAKEIEDAMLSIKGVASKIFREGRFWASAEIIHPEIPITVPYERPMILLHGVMEVDKDGNFTSAIDKKAASVLAKAINAVERKSEFSISDIPLAKLSPDRANATKFISQVHKIQSIVGADDNWTIGEYKVAMAKKIIRSKHKNLPDELVDYFANRFIFGIKKPTLAEIKRQHPEYKDVISEIDKMKSEVVGRVIFHLKKIFVSLGADVLSTMENLLVLNKDKATKKIRSALEKAIKALENINDEKTKKKAIEALGFLGDVEDKIIPSEGITFFYKGNFYKLTGSFSVAHQIINVLRTLEFGK